jgi:two-component system, response regulator, stage 0 sporulation protein F
VTESERPSTTLRVLVVEDTDHVRRMLTDMLELDGFAVESVASGPEAVEHVGADPPDVVVLDFKMPGMDGIDVAKALRSSHPDLRIIIYTAFVDDSLERAAADVGVALVLGKIEGLHALGREIRRLCAPLF